MMDYFVQGSIGRRSRVRITAEEFHTLRQSKEILSHFMTITETYRVVVESYRAVESAKHDAELDNILHSKVGYRDSLDSRVVLNSPIVAYLASARLFLDSTDRLLPVLLDAKSVANYTNLKKSMYDGRPEYRFVEALRNYVQHKNLPIHVLTYHSFVEDKSNIPDSEFVTCLSLKANRETLKKDDKFKPSALDGLPDAIDIIACIRFHMEGMWQLHNHLITKHGSMARAAREQIAAYIQKFVAETGDTPLALVATAGESGSALGDTVPLLLDWDDARIAALEKLGDLTNLHRRYISGKIQRA